MFNITGGEIIIIAVVALIILGPDKLPDFIRRAGRVYGEVKKMSTGFKTEFRDAIEEPVREMQDTVNLAKNWFEEGKTAVGTMDDSRWGTDDDDDPDTDPSARRPVPEAANADGAASAADTPASGDVIDESADDGEAFSDDDDDPNFYDENGRLLTAVDLRGDAAPVDPPAEAQDMFGTVVRRSADEGPTA